MFSAEIFFSTSKYTDNREIVMTVWRIMKNKSIVKMIICGLDTTQGFETEFTPKQIYLCILVCTVCVLNQMISFIKGQTKQQKNPPRAHHRLIRRSQNNTHCENCPFNQALQPAEKYFHLVLRQRKSRKCQIIIFVSYFKTSLCNYFTVRFRQE